MHGIRIAHRTPEEGPMWLPRRRSLCRFLLILLLTTLWCQALPDTWAVLVCASRFWYNYRHVANALSVYQLVKRLGVPDSHIILMLADDMPCNARNPIPGTVFRSLRHEVNLCDGGIEVDYKGAEVTVEAFMRVLMGRHDESWPLSKRVSSTNESRILLYMTGHGGDGFLKFHNYEEVSSEDLAVAFEDMKAAGRFNELFFIVDTCQGGTLAQEFRTDGVLAVGSSARGENSYAHQNDVQVGVALIDRFTDSTCDYLHRAAGSNGQAGVAVQRMQRVSLQRLMDSYDVEHLKSTPVLSSDHFLRPLHQVPATDFFAHSDDGITLLPLPPTTTSTGSPQLPPSPLEAPLWWSAVRGGSVESAAKFMEAGAGESSVGVLRVMHWLQGSVPWLAATVRADGEVLAWVEGALLAVGLMIIMVGLAASGEEEEPSSSASGKQKRD